MAPIKLQGDVYYPTLAGCFSGEQQLLSWEAAYAALCDPETASKSAVLRAFLEDEATVDILSNPTNPFNPPDSRSKSKFETDTAPIQVRASTGGDYNIDEIKADSLWLSKQTQIAEPAALRIAILEWQARPAAQLLSGFTEEEVAIVQEAAGILNLGASTFVTNSSILGPTGGLASDAASQFDTADQRKLRLLSIYISERIHILRISQILISWGSAKDLRPKFGDDYRVCDEWLEQLGQRILFQQTNTPNSNVSFLEQCLKAIDARIATLEQGFTWDVPGSIQEITEGKWATAQATELAHTLHLVFAHIDLFTPKFVPDNIISAWFDSMAKRDFFRGFQLPIPGAQPVIELIHLLVSFISLAILKLHVVLEDLDNRDYALWQPHYVLNSSLMDKVTNVFGYAASNLGPSPAIPAAFAWSILIFRLKAQATQLLEDRERRIEGGSGLQAGDNEMTPLEDATQFIDTTEEKEFFGTRMQYEALAEMCSIQGVFSLSARLVDIAMSMFGTNIDKISRDRMRLAQLELLRASMASKIVTYSPEVILAAYTTMDENRSFWEWVDSTQTRADPITSIFLQDMVVLYPSLLGEAQVRYPYETIPLLKFCSALTRGEKAAHAGLPSTAAILSDAISLMQRLPEGFNEYALIREEENNNWVALLADLPQFSTRSSIRMLGQRRALGAAPTFDPMVLPAETEGRVVDDTAPPYITLWSYPHSSLRYLVVLLSTFVVGSPIVEYATQEPTTIENASEIIGLFADLLSSAVRASKHHDDGTACYTELLDALDIGADQGQDTVNIVLAIFEQELLNLCEQPGNEASLEVLVNCTHFIHALVAISPARVWPWLARSRLLESDGDAGCLANILIGTEMVIGRYDFLIGCIRVFGALVQDTVERSVVRKTSNKAITRFGATPTVGSGTSDKVISTTLLTFGRTLAGIFESSLSWKYARVEDRLHINTYLTTTFTRILESTYGVDDSPKISTKLAGLLAPVAEHITTVFISMAENDLPTNPIIASLLSGTDIRNPSIRTSTMELWTRQTQAALGFSNTIIRLGMLLDRPWTHLEQQLFKATPLLARLYATNDVYKSSVVSLFESLVRGALRSLEPVSGGSKTGRAEPPSLLGHLGPKTAKNFLSILSLLDKPLGIIDIQTHVWNLLAAVVSCRQRWFALYLLTGTTPRESVRSKSAVASGPSRSKALLTYALDELANIDISQPRRTVAMLEFVSLAQNNWSWAMGSLRQHKKFLQGLLTFLKALKYSLPQHEAGILKKAYENKIVALISEILAMYLHQARQSGDFEPLKEIVPSLFYLQTNALSLPSYNVSLHTNLKKNFEARFQGTSLDNFKRTTLLPVQFGRSYFYDIELADKLLVFDAAWKGRNNMGFEDEISRANLNLSLVESQIQLLEGWKLLALELSSVVTKDSRLPKILADVARDCMIANSESPERLPEALFGHLMFVRAELAFALLQKMVVLKVEGDAVVVTRRLLNEIWNATLSATPDFDHVFASEMVNYYRLLLRTLYLSLHFHTSTGPGETMDFRQSFRASVPQKDLLVEPISTLLLQILTEVVAKGFRCLATQLHEDVSSVSPADFGLVTAILQIILKVPEMANWHGQVALLFANCNTVRYATSLFSWSDRLAIEPSHSVNSPPDPVYGELALLFLLSLSSMQLLAETMAVEGILANLASANIMKYFLRLGGMGPFDKPTRLHSIWARGILPLLLNLLCAVGAPIASEVAGFLNGFSNQLVRASRALQPRARVGSRLSEEDKITLSLASELHSLALITRIIEEFKAQGPGAGIISSDIPEIEGWDKEAVKDDVEGLIAQRGSLSERVVPIDEREVELMGRPAKGPGATQDETELEYKVRVELENVGVCLGVGETKS